MLEGLGKPTCLTGEGCVFRKAEERRSKPELRAEDEFGESAGLLRSEGEEAEEGCCCLRDRLVERRGAEEAEEEGALRRVRVPRGSKP